MERSRRAPDDLDTGLAIVALHPHFNPIVRLNCCEFGVVVDPREYSTTQEFIQSRSRVPPRYLDRFGPIWRPYRDPVRTVLGAEPPSPRQVRRLDLSQSNQTDPGDAIAVDEKRFERLG